jgi:hypothetical protein
MPEFWVTTPFWTCWVTVQEGIVVETAPYLWRDRGIRWSRFVQNIHARPGSWILPLSGPESEPLMPDMTATPPKGKTPTGSTLAPMLPVLTLAPDPTDDIVDPPVPAEVFQALATSEPSPLPVSAQTTAMQAAGQVVAEANRRLADFVEALERTDYYVADLDVTQLDKLKKALRMPQNQLQAPEGSPDTPGASKATWAEHEAQIHGFLEHLQAELRKGLVHEAAVLDQHQDKLLAFLKDWVGTTAATNEHAQYQLSSTLDAVAKNGLPVLSPPCQATVHATTPQGFPVTVTCAQLTTAGALTELSNVVVWLQENNFTVAR